MAIDDELDAIRGQYPEDSANLGLSLGLKLLSSLPDTTGLLFKISEVLRSHFSTKAISERLKLLFDALEKMGGWDEAAGLIADLSRLTDGDLEVLRLMVRFQGDKVRDNPTDSEYHLMLTEFARVREEWVKGNNSRYELYAHALRLSGFGLAHQLNWNQSSWGPQDMGFAPMPRGKRLVEILEKTDCQHNLPAA